MSFLSFILEYITYCLFFTSVLFTFILCFKVAKSLANDWYLTLKQLGSKIISTIKRKDVKE